MPETMEVQACSVLDTMVSARGEVETTRPFRSVKEAVAVFGERFLAGNAHSQKANTSAKLDINPRTIHSLPASKPVYSASSSPPSYASSASHFIQDKDDEITVFRSLRKMEAELEEMKRELALLKERESDTARAIATLNSQFHKSTSKLADIEAANAAESTMSTELPSKAHSERWRDDRIRDIEEGFEYLPSLGQALSLGGMESRRRKMKLQKKKPIIPLIGDLFSTKKGSTDFNSSLYSRSSFYSFS